MWYISYLPRLPNLFLLHSLGNSIKDKSNCVIFCSETFSDYLIIEAKYLKKATKHQKVWHPIWFPFFLGPPHSVFPKDTPFLLYFKHARHIPSAWNILFLDIVLLTLSHLLRPWWNLTFSIKPTWIIPAKLENSHEHFWIPFDCFISIALSTSSTQYTLLIYNMYVFLPITPECKFHMCRCFFYSLMLWTVSTKCLTNVCLMDRTLIRLLLQSWEQHRERN